MILFLDFDGVLHADPCYDEAMLFCHLPRFEAILRDFPSAEIVISSTWRETRKVEQLRSFFSPDIASRIIGVTPSWRDASHLFSIIGPYFRQVEIEAWMRASSRPWEDWVVIDDRSYWFRPFLPNLVVCNSKIGLTDDIETELRKKLAA